MRKQKWRYLYEYDW